MQPLSLLCHRQGGSNDKLLRVGWELNQPENGCSVDGSQETKGAGDAECR